MQNMHMPKDESASAYTGILLIILNAVTLLLPLIELTLMQVTQSVFKPLRQLLRQCTGTLIAGQHTKSEITGTSSMLLRCTIFHQWTCNLHSGRDQVEPALQYSTLTRRYLQISGSEHKLKSASKPDFQMSDYESSNHANNDAKVVILLRYRLSVC